MSNHSRTEPNPTEPSEARPHPSLQRRRGGPTLHLVVDLVQHALWSRSWAVLILVILAGIATAIGFVGQTVLPWAIYPAL